MNNETYLIYDDWFGNCITATTATYTITATAFDNVEYGVDLRKDPEKVIQEESKQRKLAILGPKRSRWN